jgi:2Fe-2S ferredoxin
MQIVLKTKAGQPQALVSLEGWTVLDTLSAHGIALPTECHGAGECGQCAIRVEPDWLVQLPPPSELEREVLANRGVAEPHARLACQLILNPPVEGLEISLLDPLPE